MVYGITGLGGGCGTGDLAGVLRFLAEFQEVVCAEMLQKQMKSLTMVTVAQVAEFMQQDIVTEYGGKTHYVKVQIDVT